MKNKFIISILFLIFFQKSFAENLNIQSKEIFIDKKTKTTVFKNEVVAIDDKKNIFKGDYAEYKKDLKLLKSIGETSIETSKGYFLTGSNITFDNLNNNIDNHNFNVPFEVYKIRSKFFIFIF